MEGQCSWTQLILSPGHEGAHWDSPSDTTRKVMPQLTPIVSCAHLSQQTSRSLLLQVTLISSTSRDPSESGTDHWLTVYTPILRGVALPRPFISALIHPLKHTSNTSQSFSCSVFTIDRSQLSIGSQWSFGLGCHFSTCDVMTSLLCTHECQAAL